MAGMQEVRAMSSAALSSTKLQPSMLCSRPSPAVEQPAALLLRLTQGGIWKVKRHFCPACSSGIMGVTSVSQRPPHRLQTEGPQYCIMRQRHCATHNHQHTVVLAGLQASSASILPHLYEVV